jgi:phospholipid/cholesterol/gamma-HCH transport system substrate-binding protein
LNPHTNYVAVGLFLLSGIVAAVILVLWLGQTGNSEPQARYIIEIDGDVNGLSNGSIVNFLGVSVGEVAEIRLRTERLPLVEVVIDIRKDLPINESTFATLVVQGVTGIANVDLANDRSQPQPLGTHASGNPVIPFRATGLSAMLAGSGDLTTEALRLLAQLNTWTGDENRWRVEEILENARALTATVADQRDDIPQMVGSLKSAIASLERTASTLESAAGENLPVMSANLQATTASLASASARVDRWLEVNNDSVDRLLGEGFEATSGLMVDLRNVSAQLNRLSTRLREDPSRLIYRASHDPVVVEP